MTNEMAIRYAQQEEAAAAVYAAAGNHEEAEAAREHAKQYRSLVTE